jgi:signal transduction histidine kinase
MLLKFCDIITTAVQSFLFVFMTNNIAYKYNKLSKVKSYIAMAIIFLEVVTFTYSSTSGPTANLLMVLGIILILMMFFRKSIVDAFLGFGVIYSTTIITSYFLLIFYQNVLVDLKLNISAEIQLLIFVFIPVWIVYFMVYKNRKNIFNAVISLKNIRHSLIFVLIADYSIIFIDTLRADSTHEGMGLLFKSSIYIITCISFIFSIIYFAKKNDKSKEVEILNNALNDKIVELQKIKHDYGSEISSLYGLYQLGKIDRIGLLLKSIVERYQNLNGAISVSEQCTPLVASVLHFATSKGINVIAFDSANYENVGISDNDFLKLISNIVKNSIDVLDKTQNPTIKYKSYNSYSDVVISISNNGPKIPEDIRSKMFEVGFSTKDNKSGDRGYGLGIVKDIINSCNGKISVISDEEWTNFHIELPVRVMEEI